MCAFRMFFIFNMQQKSKEIIEIIIRQAYILWLLIFIEDVNIYMFCFGGVGLQLISILLPHDSLLFPTGRMTLHHYQMSRALCLLALKTMQPRRHGHYTRFMGTPSIRVRLSRLGYLTWRYFKLGSTYKFMLCFYTKTSICKPLPIKSIYKPLTISCTFGYNACTLYTLIRLAAMIGILNFMCSVTLLKCCHLTW